MGRNILKGREPRSFATCFFLAVGFAALITGILIASMDRIKKALGLERPDSEVGRAIDEHIPQIQAVRTYEDRVKPGLQLAQMKRIKDAFALYYVHNNKLPESLEELAAGGGIDRGAFTDVWGQQLLLLPAENEVYLLSAGQDRIRNTADDIIVSLLSPALEPSDEERAKIPALIEQQLMSRLVEPE